MAGDERDGVGCGRGQDALAGALHGEAGVGVFDEGEMGGDAGFEREAAQERLAERMDGADSHAAGEVENAGEQGAGLGDRVGSDRDTEVDEGLVEGVVVADGPFAEFGLQAVGHFRGGRLGEGQALDLGRVGAGEHQAEHAVDEQLGLARPGGRFDECGDGRVRRAKLLVDRALLRGRRRNMVHFSSSCSDHSATRASWA